MAELMDLVTVSGNWLMETLSARELAALMEAKSAKEVGSRSPFEILSAGPNGGSILGMRWKLEALECPRGSQRRLDS